MKASKLVTLLANYRKIDCGVLKESEEQPTIKEVVENKFKNEDFAWRVVYDPQGILNENVTTGRQYLYAYDEKFEDEDKEIVGIIYTGGGMHIYLYEIED